ncbi:recA-like protein [Erythrobacter sp. Alg231-14]|uniref:recA-like protein n=1 Tax=Erythrobacter sp. Alg231-14 TaxID=1922225 RepID=UPI00307B9010
MKNSILPSGVKAHDALTETLSVPSLPKERAARVRLSANDIVASPKDLVREGRWRPGLSDQPLHSEIFASASDAGGAGLALALACDALLSDALSCDALSVDGNAKRRRDPTAEAIDRRQVLWVQDKRAVERSGRPFAQGLPPELRDRLIHVEAQNAQDALFALEEGLKCRDLACVIGEIVGNPRALDFTASRRLSLTAQKQGIALWLVRLEAEADLSSARMRWQAEPAPSAPPLWNADAPGAPAWKAELFRARNHAPGKWILSNEDGRLCAQQPPENRSGNRHHSAQQYTARSQNIGHLVRPTVGRSLAAVARA